MTGESPSATGGASAAPPSAGSLRARVSSLDTASLLRIGLFVLVAATFLGTVLELAFLRHWGGTQTIVWIGLAGVAVALLLLAVRPTRQRVLAGRWIALAVFVVAGLGVFFHVRENMNAGPMDRDYADSWDSRPVIEQLWLAATGSVGPAPALAPGVLAEMGFALVLASLRHPALERAPRDARTAT